MQMNHNRSLYNRLCKHRQRMGITITNRLTWTVYSLSHAVVLHRLVLHRLVLHRLTVHVTSRFASKRSSSLNAVMEFQRSHAIKTFCRVEM